MRAVFMGTPDFAVSILDAVHDAGHELLCCVSQPDRPVGRHALLKPTAVKKRAMELGITVLQPEKASDPGFIASIRKLSPDVIVVAAYGKILKKELLDIPRYGCINIHASLLPRWRGAAPIQWAVIEGDEYAGVTSMLMDEGMDTGAMILKKSIPLTPCETGGSLFERLAALGADLIKETLAALEDGSAVPVPQPAEGVTYAPMLKKETGNIDWTRDASSIERLSRGLSPWPGTYSYSGKKLIKLEKLRVACQDEVFPGAVPSDDIRPGDTITKGQHLYVCCGKDFIEILKVCPEGKKPMDAADFLRGNSLNRLCQRKEG